MVRDVGVAKRVDPPSARARPLGQAGVLRPPQPQVGTPGARLGTVVGEAKVWRLIALEPTALEEPNTLVLTAFGEPITLELTAFGEPITLVLTAFEEPITLALTAHGEPIILALTAFGEPITLELTAFGEPITLVLTAHHATGLSDLA